MSAYVLDPARTRDIGPEVLDENGRLRILSASYWATTCAEERALLGYRHGLYGLPTVELVEHLKELIGDRTAIEIGAGSGVLAEALGIRATDNRMQEIPKYREALTAAGQPCVRYGPNVIKSDAVRAVQVYKPEVVIGCWITHRYERSRHWAGGNEIGVREEEIIRLAEYIFIGNERVHRSKKIWDLPHEIEYPSFVFSRSMNGTRDFIATWRPSE